MALPLADLLAMLASGREGGIPASDLRAVVSELYSLGWTREQLDQVIADELPIDTSVRAMRVASFGDSWMNPDVIFQVGNTRIRPGESICSWANAHLGQPFDIVGTFGINSERSDQILARVQTMLASNPDIVVISAGGNDVLANVASATSIANLTAIYDEIRQAGPLVAVGSLPTTTALSTAQRVLSRAISEFNRQYAANNRNMLFIDWAKYLSDPVNYAFRPGYGYDAIHPNHLGASWAGKALADALRPFMKRIDRMPLSNADPFRGVNNPLALGTGSADGKPGYLPFWRSAALSGTPAAAYSKVARTDGIPAEIQRIVQTGAGTMAYYDETGTTTTQFGKGIEPGDTVEGLIEFGTCDLSGASAFKISVTAYHSGGTVAAETFAEVFSRVGGTGRHLEPGAVIRTPTLALPAGTTRVQLGIQMTGTGTIEFSRNTVRKV